MQGCRDGQGWQAEERAPQNDSRIHVPIPMAVMTAPPNAPPHPVNPDSLPPLVQRIHLKLLHQRDWGLAVWGTVPR